MAKEELDYFEKQYGITQDRYHAGDIAQMDMQRIHLQRVQYESDYQTALTNLRTAKITLLALLDQRTPVDQFDVDGRFDFDQNLDPLEHFHEIALDQRPDLRAAVAGGREGRYRSPPRGSQRVDRSHLQRLVHA